MSERSIGVACPFTGVEDLPIPDVLSKCYGKVPVLDEKFDIWYFHHSTVMLHGLIHIVESILKPKGQSYDDIMHKCQSVVEITKNKGLLKQQDLWFFIKLPKKVD